MGRYTWEILLQSQFILPNTQQAKMLRCGSLQQRLFFFCKANKQEGKKQALDLPPWKARGWAVSGLEGVKGMGKINYKKVW